MKKLFAIILVVAIVMCACGVAAGEGKTRKTTGKYTETVVHQEGDHKTEEHILIQIDPDEGFLEVDGPDQGGFSEVDPVAVYPVVPVCVLPPEQEPVHVYPVDPVLVDPHDPVAVYPVVPVFVYPPELEPIQVYPVEPVTVYPVISEIPELYCWPHEELISHPKGELVIPLHHHIHFPQLVAKTN